MIEFLKRTIEIFLYCAEGKKKKGHGFLNNRIFKKKILRHLASYDDSDRWVKLVKDKIK